MAKWILPQIGHRDTYCRGTGTQQTGPVADAVVAQAAYDAEPPNGAPHPQDEEDQQEHADGEEPDQDR
jgi:hypothetical protein